MHCADLISPIRCVNPTRREASGGKIALINQIKKMRCP